MSRGGPHKGLLYNEELSPQPDRSWAAFWRTVTKFEHEKVTPGLAVRNCAGVLIPISIGIAIGQTAGGLVASTGALNVCFSDGPEPYWQRGRRMLTATMLVALAVFAGGISGKTNMAAVLLAGIWAFAAGMMVALGTEAADLGTVSLVTLVVFGAQSLSPRQAALSGALAFCGGLLQTGLALALWPVRRYEPERRELINLYRELAGAVASPIEAAEAPPATGQMLKAQKALSTLARDHSIDAERYRSLLNQAERMRLSMLALSRLRVRIRREDPNPEHSETVEQFVAQASRELMDVCTLLSANGARGAQPVAFGAPYELSKRLRTNEAGQVADLLHDARVQVDALDGQLRSAADLARNATSSGQQEFEEKELRRSWRLRLGGTLATLRAHLTFRSAACRHGIRLAAAVALGDAIGRGMGLVRPYWIPMTIAIVLKPDFTTTFSRGVLRLAGTFAGLVLATVLFHLMAPTAAVQVVLIGLFVFLLRWVGGANYGIFVTAVSALVVLLVALTGVAPKQVIAARGLNTLVGGSLALLAYLAWPTWERTQVGEAMALMLDAYRDYFRQVAQAYLQPGKNFETELEGLRQTARLARSSAEASVDRLAGEPGTSAEALNTLHAMLASSHRLVHAMMSLEASLNDPKRPPARPAFQNLAHNVEKTMYLLSSAMRGAALQPEHVPDLRADHQRLMESGNLTPERYALANVETDRVVNSLNTLAGQTLLWTARPL